MNRLIIIQTAAPTYRAEFFSFLEKKMNKNFILYSGKRYFQPSVVSDQKINYYTIKNVYFFKRSLLFQAGGLWKNLFSADIIVLELNPRIISNWIFVMIRKVFKYKTFLWGHAWPKTGIKSWSEKIRNTMRELSSGVIVYSEKQKKELKKKSPKLKVFTAVNALYHEKTLIYKNSDNDEVKNIVYSGRLTKQKKVMKLLKAYADAIDLLDKKANLIIIGSGPLKQKVLEFINKNKLKDRVFLKGKIYDKNTLEKIYNTALCSISPGYVGLSIIQSFSFGVPMIVSKNENHSPEIDAVIENQNAVYEERSLSETMLKFFNNKHYWISRRAHIKRHSQKNYTIEKMAMPFFEILKA